jgi:hypothetical protein
MINPRALATLGVGISPRMSAALGLWIDTPAQPPIVIAPTFYTGSGGGGWPVYPVKKHHPPEKLPHPYPVFIEQQDEELEMLLCLLAVAQL